ncbi:MAG: precorrin-3B C(17)-methyltransferase, partial [Acidimicrobiales bacterium]
VAEILGAEAVVTTASDQAGIPALDQLPGLSASGDVAGVTTAMLAGRAPIVSEELPGWVTPDLIESGAGPERIVVTDCVVPESPGVVALHPPSLVVGVGCSTDASPHELEHLLDTTLQGAGLVFESVAQVATIDRRGDHAAVRGLGRPVQTFTAAQLEIVRVPNPNERVATAVGTQSVAEAAALLAAGRDAVLVVEKHKSGSCTVAVARRQRRPGHLSLVGLGPGDGAFRTPAATTAVRHADFVIGYRPYVDQVSDLLTASQCVVRSPIGDEVSRAREALTEAAKGRRVAIVCSGDPGVYAMASITLGLADEFGPDVEIEVVPGVTAALAASAVLGAPLGHDHASISLSDLLTPWEAIERRVRSAAEADFVITLYNPRSVGRRWQLQATLNILLEHRHPSTPVGIVTDAGRPFQRAVITTLERVDSETIGMTTSVIVGASTTHIVAGRMVTPRGYQS